MKIIGWFSCGNNSAVMSKLLIEQYRNDDVRIVRCVVANEHPDNERFHIDIEAWIGRPIERAASSEYADCWEVWERKQYLAGISGAPCTVEMKKAVRWVIERTWGPDAQAFGFSKDEMKRADLFKKNNPEIKVLCPLITSGISKPMCAEIITGAGIELPTMYKLGFSNNNCRCCVKATSIVYWARSRYYFPVEFERLAVLSRQLDCRLVRSHNKRIFLDEIPADYNWRDGIDRSKSVECGVGCGISVKQEMRKAGFIL